MIVYRGMDRAALDAAYNNTAAVGQARRDRYVADWSARSDAFRTDHAGRIDLRYGDGARQRLDVFPCGRPGTPTLVYIHGGYWQMNDKEPYAFVGEALLPAGFNLALLEYTLAPAVRLDRIVGEVRTAVAWVIDHAKEFGGDPGRVFVAGHSAGGHLTAVAMDDARVAGGVAISGIYDLEPIRLNYLNDKLGLDPAEAARTSPLHHLPAQAAPLIVAVGLGELPELIRQSEEYAAAWQRHGLRGRYLPLAGHDHFSILEELAYPGGKILAALQDLAR
ncbi:MAG TPA: alpha/beta hydrolase [Methylomirabilota bacterium]|jgi:acetyl esterase/lipase|nr:alpha/beta hydrolase [Methylomirabilota bacterium]